MLKKWIILGCVFLTLGMSAVVSVYGWRDAVSFKPLLHLLGYNDPFALAPADANWAGNDLSSDPNTLRKLSQRTEEQQHQSLQANLHTLMFNTPEDSQLAQALYGDNWRAELEAYKTKLAHREMIATWSTVVTLLGVLWVVGCGLITWAHAITGAWKARSAEREKEEEDEDEEIEKESEASESQDTVDESQENDVVKPTKRECLIDSDEPAPRPPRRPKLDVSDTLYRSQTETSPKTPSFRRKYASLDYGFAHQNYDEEHIGALLSDEDSVLPEKRLAQPPLLKRPSDNPGNDRPTGSSPHPADDKDLQKQTAVLAAQVAQLSEKTHGQKNGDETSEPINQTLKNLSEQVSAIRSFAATQQDRVEKLQSGYDWNIIRTFCLRIIRCLDNLEHRMEDLEKDGQNIADLTDVRDELLFALESSGVEQYELDTDRPFRGQERRAEAVKEKQASPSEELKGCIAAMVSPGYQYVIDEDNMRVVRMARVKLYE